jgi:hypothetical protein
VSAAQGFMAYANSVSGGVLKLRYFESDAALNA